MKKLLMFLLSVMILSVTGCGSTKKVATDAKAGYEDTETVNDTEAVTTETPKEEITVEEQEAETTWIIVNIVDTNLYNNFLRAAA